MRLRLAVKVIHSFFLVLTLLIAVIILMPGDAFGLSSWNLEDAVTLQTVEGVLVLASGLELLLGISWRILKKRFGKHATTELDVLNAHFSRITLFGATGINVFILHALGSEWWILLMLLISAAIMLAVTFPTDSRLERWQQN